MPSTDTTLRELISRLFLWRVGIPWYLAALLPAPLASAAVLFALSLLAILMHAVLSASTLILQPASARGQFTWNILLGLALWFVVAAVAKAKPDELSRRPVQVAAGQVS